MKITEKTDPKEVSKKTMETIKTIPSMRLGNPEGTQEGENPLRSQEENLESFSYFLDLINKKRLSEYCWVNDFEDYIISRMDTSYDNYDKVDDTKRVAQECIDLIMDTQYRLVDKHIPYDQIQISSHLNLICKKEVIDRIIKEMGPVSNPMTDEEKAKLRRLLGEIDPSDVADKVCVQIGGNVDATGLSNNSLRQMDKALLEAEKNDTYTSLMFIVSPIAVSYERILFESEIISGVIDLQEFTKIMEEAGYDISFGSTLASSENVKESYISEYCKEGKGFDFNITLDFGRKKSNEKEKQKKIGAK